jgi:hypothetical protein
MLAITNNEKRPPHIAKPEPLSLQVLTTLIKTIMEKNVKTNVRNENNISCCSGSILSPLLSFQIVLGD